jgi:ABC-2 type transport system permease protein
LGFGAAWAITGLVMTGVTAVACQLTSSARGAAGWALGTLGVLFVLRAVGDTATSDAGRSLRWISPLGWVNQVFPFGADRLWLVGLGALVGALLVGVAFALLERRDLGAGLLASRPGRARAPRTLSGPIGLAWRLTRTPMIGWLVTMVFLGAIYGNLIANVEQMLGDPNVARILAQTAGVSVDQLTTAMAAVYSATMLKISVGFISAAGIAVIVRLAVEERSGRGEVVMASATSRARWFLAYAVGGLALVALLTLVMAFVMGSRGAAALAEGPFGRADPAGCRRGDPRGVGRRRRGRPAHGTQRPLGALRVGRARRPPSCWGGVRDDDEPAVLARGALPVRARRGLPPRSLGLGQGPRPSPRSRWCSREPVSRHTDGAT